MPFAPQMPCWLLENATGQNSARRPSFSLDRRCEAADVLTSQPYPYRVRARRRCWVISDWAF